MTYRQWEKAFRKRLSRLPKEERERALGYYAELYGDKLDAGVSESEIVREFGDPKAAADKIIEESAETASAQGKTVRRGRQATRRRAPLRRCCCFCSWVCPCSPSYSASRWRARRCF